MMKHSLGLLSAAFLGTLIVISAVSFSQVPPEDIKKTARPVLMPGRLEVQFETDVPTERLSGSINRVSVGISSLDRNLQEIGAVDAIPLFPWHRGREAGVGPDDMSRFFEIVFSEEHNINDVIENLQKNPYIRSVSPVYAMPLYVEPNDPNFSSQWGLKKINDTAAWNVEKGSDTVKIAIIDSGVLYSHPDLRDNIWVNPGEDLDNDMVVYDTDDSNNTDDDGNGLDDLIGYDFFTGFSSGVTCEDADCGVPDNNPIDWNGHGTHCAGIAAAVMNNSLGVASVAGGWGGGLGPYAGPRIMCIRVGASGYHPDYGHTGYVNSANCATGIDYAVTMGADIINCSWGMSQSAAMTTALLRADSAGVVVFHAAGNENSTSGDYYDTWSPPSVGHKLVVTIAWTTSSDVKAYSSNYGWWVDICAPGSSIYSTYASNYTATYGYASGTSMAAPHVAGVAALIKSHMPDYKRDEIVPLIIYNADPMPNEQLWLQGQLGSGRVNAYNCLDSLPAAAFSAGPDLIGEAPLEVSFTDESPYLPSSWTWDFGDGGASYQQHPNHTFNTHGLHTVSLTVDDEFGTATEVLKNLVMVTADTVKMKILSVPPDTTIIYPVYLDNKYLVKTIIFPFRIRETDGGIPNYITFDSATVEGTRTEYFEQVSLLTSDPFGHRYTYSLRSDLTGGSTYLVPDTGTILNLHLTISASAPLGEALFIEDTTLSGRSLKIESIVYDYTPVMVPGNIYISVCTRGDVNGDGDINMLDILFLVAYLYKGGAAPDPGCGDVDANGATNMLDILYLIAYLYKGGPPPPP